MKYILIFIVAILLTIIALVTYPFHVIIRFLWSFKFSLVEGTVFDRCEVTSHNLFYEIFPLFSPSCRRLYGHKTFFHYIWYYPNPNNGLVKSKKTLHIIGGEISDEQFFD